MSRSRWENPVPKHPWMEEAHCAQVDPELFFPHGMGSVTRVMASQARAICIDCPVIEPCRDMAMADPRIEGVWGGLTTEDRRRMRKERRSAS